MRDGDANCVVVMDIYGVCVVESGNWSVMTGIDGSAWGWLVVMKGQW